MSTLRLARALPLLALLLSPSAFAQDARPAPVAESAPDASAKQEAARRFEHAIKLYEDADYTLALAEFERVYELVPDYRVLYNIGQVSIQLGRYARAFRTLKEYVARGAAELAPDRAAAVEADLTQLAAKIARVSVQVEQTGAQISVDGAVIGRSSLVEPLILDVGEHRIQVDLPGFVTQVRTFTLAGGDRREARFALQAQPRVPAPQPASGYTPQVVPPPRTPAASSHQSTWVGVGWAATGALAAGALVSGAMGAVAVGDLRELRSTAGTSRGALDQAQARAASRLLIADVLGGATLVTGGFSLYFQLARSSRERAGPQKTSTLQLLLGPNQAQLVFQN